MKPPTMTPTEANRVTGGLSHPSKMPCPAYSIPAQRCVNGQKMRDVEGSVCSKCYALKGNYGFPGVRDALEKRYTALMEEPMWARGMAYLIRSSGTGWFRWHDSGDLQSVAHLKKIIEVCKLTPNVKHWLPTREYAMVTKLLDAGGVVPKNLTIRLSAMMLDGVPPTAIAKRLGVTVSGVGKTEYNCPASTQDNKCGECRLCWDKSKFNVTYKQH